MAFEEANAGQQALADGLASALYARVQAAPVVETLSTRGDKLLEVREDLDGERFVTRSFSPEAVDHVERHGTDFATAFQGMHDVFADAGIEVVRGHLIKTEDEAFPFVAVQEYLEGAQDLSAAPTEAKEAVARSLGGMLVGPGNWLPTPEMLSASMFGVTDIDGEAQVKLMDTDPHMLSDTHIVTRSESGKAWYLGRLGELFWDKWCEPEERQAVFVELVKSVADLAVEGDPLGELSRQFQIIHLMSNGVDTRQL